MKNKTKGIIVAVLEEQEQFLEQVQQQELIQTGEQKLLMRQVQQLEMQVTQRKMNCLEQMEKMFLTQ